MRARSDETGMALLSALAETGALGAVIGTTADCRGAEELTSGGQKDDGKLRAMTFSSKVKSFRSRFFSSHDKAKEKEMKQKLLNPLSFSSPNYEEAIQENFKPHWIIGIDPNLSGALAVLKFDNKGCCSAQVYDTPQLQVVVQKIPRTRYNSKSMLELIRTLDVPSGTKAFVAKSINYQNDNIADLDMDYG
ncbi:unnamed protein product [Arabidopsis arenosa]|uniref:Uncharacterized protein n=1 Tax=Arabidopsis arenosa TaxID=38785 RepID=A0A8S2AFN8_ARAAE|nr:unnamed protein product [Arabidopsis arenosa]